MGHHLKNKHEIDHLVTDTLNLTSEMMYGSTFEGAKIDARGVN